jgi:hypothetical protein
MLQTGQVRDSELSSEARFWSSFQAVSLELDLKLPFGNLEEGEHPPLEAATKQRLVTVITDRELVVCPVVICEGYRTART